MVKQKITIEDFSNPSRELNLTEELDDKLEGTEMLKAALKPEGIKEYNPAQKMIKIEQVVDKFTTIRNRIPFYEGYVCNYCGASALRIFDVERPEELTKEEQDIARSRVQKHIDKNHSPSQQTIVEMKDIPTEWRGDKKAQREKERKERIFSGDL